MHGARAGDLGLSAGGSGWKLDAMSDQLRNAVTADEIKHMRVKYVRDWETG